MSKRMLVAAPLNQLRPYVEFGKSLSDSAVKLERKHTLEILKANGLQYAIECLEEIWAEEDKEKNNGN